MAEIWTVEPGAMLPVTFTESMVTEPDPQLLNGTEAPVTEATSTKPSMTTSWEVFILTQEEGFQSGTGDGDG